MPFILRPHEVNLSKTSVCDGHSAWAINYFRVQANNYPSVEFWDKWKLHDINLR